MELTEDARFEADDKVVIVLDDTHMKCYGCGSMFYDERQIAIIADKVRSGKYRTEREPKS